MHACSAQNSEALYNLLAAVPDMAPAPYIIAGHSAGGQLALNYATKHRSDVAGLALLDKWVPCLVGGHADTHVRTWRKGGLHLQVQWGC